MALRDDAVYKSAEGIGGKVIVNFEPRRNNVNETHGVCIEGIKIFLTLVNKGQKKRQQKNKTENFLKNGRTQEIN